MKTQRSTTHHRGPTATIRTLQNPRRTLLVLAATSLFALPAPPALAATIAVDGSVCTLAEAMFNANSDSDGFGNGCAAGQGADVLTLSSNQVLSAVNNTDPFGPTGLPVVSSDITIQGNGHSIVRDASAEPFRILAVGSGSLNLQRTTISGGLLTTASAYNGAGIANYFGVVRLIDSTVSGNKTVADGGGIVNRHGTLSLSNSTVSDNSANFGGGINNFSGSLSLSNSTVSGNRAARNGGGFYNSTGDLSLSESTISGNSAASFGGGLANHRGTLNLDRSTVSGNSANSGGGIFSFTSEGGSDTTTVSNSTLSGNLASSEGGGLLNSYGRTIIRNSTVTDNTAPANFGAGVGSGVASTRPRIALSEISTSIIAGNIGTNVDFLQGDVSSFSSLGDNLVGDGSAVSVFTASGDQTGIADPGLAALANNGGPTRTHALKSGSLAIDAVTGTCPQPTIDQRGSPRPVGGACDIGSFEGGGAPANVVSSLSLSPASATRQTLENQCVTVSAKTSAGVPVPGKDIAFNRTGANPGAQTVATNGAGQAQHCWTGVNGGVDHVIATFGNLVSNESLITWNKPLTSITPEAVTVTLAVGQPLLKLAPTATLRDTVANVPIAGRTVQFTAGATPLCSAVTNASGVAKCNATVSSTLGSVLSLGYTAKFAGDSTYASAEKKGPPLIIKLGL